MPGFKKAEMGLNDADQLVYSDGSGIVVHDVTKQRTITAAELEAIWDDDETGATIEVVQGPAVVTPIVLLPITLDLTAPDNPTVQWIAYLPGANNPDVLNLGEQIGGVYSVAEADWAIGTYVAEYQAGSPPIPPNGALLLPGATLYIRVANAAKPTSGEITIAW